MPSRLTSAATFLGIALIPVSPAAAADEIVAAPAALTFPTTVPGSTAAAQSVTFTNPFPLVGFLLQSPPIVMEGAAAADYAVASTTCATILDGSGTCTAAISFRPKGTGTRDATAVLTNSVGTRVSGVALSGTALQAPGALTVTVPTFARVAPGARQGGTVTVTNTGTVPIRLGATAIAGADARLFSIGSIDTCSGATLGPGGSCGMQVVFAPVRAGAATASLTLTSADLTAALTATLSGTSAVPEPVLPFYSGNVPICHSGNGKNYVHNAPSYSSIVGGSGHAAHAADIIPAFRYPGGTFPGRNWTAAGIATYVRQGCGAAPGTAEPSRVVPPQPPVQAQVTLCEARGARRWDRVTVAADVAFAAHARLHPNDIIPPFSIASAGGAVAFPGLNWDAAGTRILAGGCVEPAPTRPVVPAESVVQCTPTGTGGLVRAALTPATARDLARRFPEAITPPFTLPDGTRFPGQNWTAEGRATFDNGCVPPEPPGAPVTPSVCVTVAADGGLTAHFDVDNANPGLVRVPAGADNALTAAGGAPPSQVPTAFAPGVTADALRVSGIPAAGSVTWTVRYRGHVGAATASGASARCAIPPDPVAQLGIDASCVKLTGSTYTAVFGYVNGAPGEITPARSRLGVGGSGPAFRPPVPPATFAPGTHPSALEVTGIPRGRTVAWRVQDGTVNLFAMAHEGLPACVAEPPLPMLVPTPVQATALRPPEPALRAPMGVFVSCVRENGDGTYDAVFGTVNANATARDVPAGPANSVTPAFTGRAGADQGQATHFPPGGSSAAWTARGIPVAQTVTWTVADGGTAQASAGVGARRCAPSPATRPPTPTPTQPAIPPLASIQPSSSRVGVFAECVSVTGRTYKATFGYEMDGPGPLPIPVGRRNRVAPQVLGDAGRIRPPSVFVPGRHPAVFTVSGIPLGRLVGWRVETPDGTVAVATSAPSGPDCTTDARPPEPAITLDVHATTSAAVPGLPTVAEVTVTNTGTTTANTVVVTVPSVAGRPARPTAASGAGRCGRVGGSAVLAIGGLGPGRSSTCTITVRVAGCEARQLTVGASGTALRIDRTVTRRASSSGGPRRCTSAVPVTG